MAQEVIADFAGGALPPPPGVVDCPRFETQFQSPVWLSPVASGRLRGTGTTTDHLVVGGRTVWVESGPAPAAIVASHPNRLGSAEDLPAMIDLAGRFGASCHIEIDPLLVGVVEVPAPARPTVCWPGGGSPAGQAAAARAQQGAAAMRRRLTQIGGLMFPVEHPLGRTITVVLPVPADGVVAALAQSGVGLDRAEFWEGGVSMTVGWWHTRDQIDALTAAVASLLAGNDPAPVPPDRFDRIPDDLPLRRLATSGGSSSPPASCLP